jgi:hypothetical protein
VNETLKALRQDAEVVAAKYELNWDQLSDPIESKYLEDTLQKVLVNIPVLEGLHDKLSSGKSVLIHDQATALPYEDVEKYRIALEEQLFDAYIMRDIHARYTLITSILTNA